MLSSTVCFLGLGWLLNAPLALATPLAQRATDERLVFCHFMMGIVGNRDSSDDYDADMIGAKDAGIDAFALNVGADSHTDKQLEYAYASAAKNDFKVFISFDFSSYSPSSAATVGKQIAKFANKPGQLKVNGRPFVSSFLGDGLDVAAMKKAAGSDVFFVPNFNPDQTKSIKSLDGAFNWQAWPNNGNNKAPTSANNVTVEDGDAAYEEWLGDKAYMASISPWFFTHFGPEAAQAKNWVFPTGSLLFDRWTEVLTQDFEFVEILSWNDYGESHYIGPLNSTHLDDGSSKWVNDMPHDGWRQLSKPFIAAYKAGASSVDDHITENQLVYWYRRTLNSLDCDATDSTAGRRAKNDSGSYFEGRPNGYQTMDDVVYVATLLKDSASLTIRSGDHSETHNMAAGANILQIPASIGSQSFRLEFEDGGVLEGTSLMEIEDTCPCGLYNYNAYVGQLPVGPSDHLLPDGFAAFTDGLRVKTCEPTPTLGEEPASVTVYDSNDGWEGDDNGRADSADGAEDDDDSLGAVSAIPSVMGLLALTMFYY